MNSETLVALILVGAFLSYEVRLFRIAFFSGRASAIVHTTGASFDAIFPRDRTDCDFGLLWETQLTTLRMLQRAGSCGISAHQLTRLFHGFSRSYPELSEGLSFEEWLNWMNAEALTVSNNDRIAIAEKGRFILDDLERNHAFVSQRCA